MDRLKSVIDEQISLNAGKNLFYKDENLFSFSNNLLFIVDSINENNDYSLNILIDYAVKKNLQEFCRINQYYDFNTDAKNELKSIYTNLITKIKNKSYTCNNALFQDHRISLRNWLSKTNPFSEKIYSDDDRILSPVTCSEYDPRIQLEILNIDLSKMTEPVLDIGCGTKAGLVIHLREKGISAFGIDRFVSDLPYTDMENWLEYDYGTKKWGTIISNLGFSNHFLHHHLRKDGNYISYAKKYMQILNSLRIGGSFHYAPTLPFIEQHINNSAYQIVRHQIEGQKSQSTTIMRLQ